MLILTFIFEHQTYLTTIPNFFLRILISRKYCFSKRKNNTL